MHDTLWSCRAFFSTFVCAAVLCGGPLVAVCAAQEEGDLRLQGGPTEAEGRLEIYHAGEWGTICDDGFRHDPTDVNAQVACGQLGYAGGEWVTNDPPGTPYGLPPYDARPPMWLDDVACTGTEPRLLDCPSDDWGENNCGAPLENVHISCGVGLSLSVSRRHD